MPVALVTGAGGFLGRNIVPELVRSGWDVVGVTRRSEQPTAGVRWIKADLALAPPLAEADVVIHLACPPRELMVIDSNALQAVRQIDSNVLVTARHARLTVLVSSAAVYGDRHPIGAKVGEDAPLAATAPYGRAKADQEDRWRAALPLERLLLIRLFNVTGPGEPASLVSRAVADRLRAAQPGQSIEIRSSESVRDFIDIRDAAAALRALVLAGSAGVINVCSGNSTLVRTLAEKLVAISGRTVRLDPDGDGAESRSVGDPSRLHGRVPWRPRWDLEAGLRAVWAEALAAVPERSR